MVSLTTRQLRRVLWAAAAALTVLWLAVTAACLVSPLASAPPVRHAAPAGLDTAPAPQGLRPSLETYALLWKRDLRSPLFDPPASAPAPRPPPPRPQLAMRLLGTALEGAASRGFFDVPGEGLKLAGVGERVGGALIQTIQEGAVQVEFQGQALTLKIQPEGR